MPKAGKHQQLSKEPEDSFYNNQISQLGKKSQTKQTNTNTKKFTNNDQESLFSIQKREKTPENISFDEMEEGPIRFLGKGKNLLGTSVNYSATMCSKSKFLSGVSPLKYKRLKLKNESDKAKGHESILPEFMSRRFQERIKIEKTIKLARSKSDLHFPEKEVIRKFNEYPLAEVKELKAFLMTLHIADVERLKKVRNFKSFRISDMHRSNSAMIRKTQKQLSDSIIEDNYNGQGKGENFGIVATRSMRKPYIPAEFPHDISEDPTPKFVCEDD